MTIAELRLRWQDLVDKTRRWFPCEHLNSPFGKFNGIYDQAI